MQVVDDEFFQVLGVVPLRGRPQDEGDRSGAPPAAVVNQKLAARLFHQGEALGRRLVIGTGSYQRQIEIVGVVPDLRLYELTREVRPMIFEAIRQRPDQSFPSILARTREGGAQDLVPEVRALVHSIDAGVPLVGTPTLEDELSARTSRPRFRTLLLSAFGMTALLLAVIGVYGVMAYGVAQRSREIGVRIALGARPRQIRAWGVRQGLLLTSLGLLLGMAGARAASQLLESHLYQLSIHDELSYATALLLLFFAAFLAAWLPAQRASRTDPMEALRCE